MKILVTGGAGFIGSHVVEKLIADGHTPIVIDNLSAGRRENLPAGVELHEVDIRSAEAAALVIGTKPDAIIHLAAHIDLRRSVAEPVFDADVNVLGTVRLLHAAVEAGCPQFVLASSAAVYGFAPATPTPEDHPTVPVTPYGAAKLSDEHYVGVFRELHGLRGAVLRFANVYGPRQGGQGGQGEGGVISVFASELAADRPCRLYGDGGATRDFTYVTDIAEAVVRAATEGWDGTWNLGTTRETSVTQLIEMMSAIAGSDAEPDRQLPVPKETRRSALIVTKIAADHGWHPAVTLEEGLKRTYEWFAQH
jgi:UDP-glucose 4-epimerase